MTKAGCITQSAPFITRAAAGPEAEIGVVVERRFLGVRCTSVAHDRQHFARLTCQLIEQQNLYSTFWPSIGVALMTCPIATFVADPII